MWTNSEHGKVKRQGNQGRNSDGKNRPDIFTQLTSFTQHIQSQHRQYREIQAKNLSEFSK